MHNTLSGMEVGGTGNILKGNTALGNNPDLQDDTGACILNHWRNNNFTTSTPACIH
jgi:hypothetical protein